jgi:hypothetical protein
VAIYDPALFLTRNDKELLRLLGELVLAQEGVEWRTNHPSDHIPLSDAEADTLLCLLEEFVATKRFRESAYFVEKLFSDEYNPNQLRDIYLKWRKKYGKSRAVATIQWQNFLARLGAITPFEGANRIWYRASATRMAPEHFLRMEQRLIVAAGLSPRVETLIVDYLKSRIESVERVRSRQLRLHEGQVSEKPTEIIEALKKGQEGHLGYQPIRASKIAAVMTIVMDLSALYTTRDWSVTGFLSTVAGALPTAALDQ